MMITVANGISAGGWTHSNDIVTTASAVEGYIVASPIVNWKVIGMDSGNVVTFTTGTADSTNFISSIKRIMSNCGTTLSQEVSEIDLEEGEKALRDFGFKGKDGKWTDEGLYIALVRFADSKKDELIDLAKKGIERRKEKKASAKKECESC